MWSSNMGAIKQEERTGYRQRRRHPEPKYSMPQTPPTVWDLWVRERKKETLNADEHLAMEWNGA